MKILIYAKPTFEGASFYNSKHWAKVGERFFHTFEGLADVYLCLNKFQINEVSVDREKIIYFDYESIDEEHRYELDFIFNDKGKIERSTYYLKKAAPELNGSCKFDLIICLADKGLALRSIYKDIPIYSFVESICTRKPFPTLFHFDPYGIDDTDIFNSLGLDEILKDEQNQLQLSEIQSLKGAYQNKFEEIGINYILEGFKDYVLFPLQYEGVSALRLYSKFFSQQEALLYVLSKYNSQNILVTEHPQYPVLSANFVYNTRLLFKNFHYKAENILIEGLSSFLIPRAKFVVAQTSSVGAQASLIFDKQVISICKKNRLTPFADLSLKENSKELSAKLLNWMFRKFDLPIEVIFNKKYSESILDILVHEHSNPKKYTSRIEEFNLLEYHYECLHESFNQLNVRNSNFIKYAFTTPAIIGKVNLDNLDLNKQSNKSQNNKHILLYTPAMTRIRGGIEQLISKIAPVLVNDGFKVTVITHDRGLKIANKPVYDLPSQVNVINFTFGLRRENIRNLSKIIDEISPDGIIVMDGANVFMQFALALVGKSVPLAFSEHFAPDFSANQLPQSQLKSRNDLINYCDAFHILEENYIDSVDIKYREKVQVIHNPIAAPKSFASIGFKKNYKLINVARIHFKQKNQPILIKAFESLQSDFPNWTLHLYGAAFDKNDADVLKSVLAQNKFKNRIFWHDQIEHDQLLEELKNSDIFVMPSNYEGSSISLVEAMAIGLPSIGFERCEGVNCLIQSGINGLLAPNINDFKSLALTMRIMMSSISLRERYSQMARKIIVERNETKVYENWLDFVHRVLQIKRGKHEFIFDEYYKHLI